MRRVLPCLLLSLLMACSDETESGSGEGGAGTGGGEIPAQGAYLACAPGEVALDDGSCVAPGVAADGCGEGFNHDGDAGCVAVMPSGVCPVGLMAIPGDVACRDVAPCAAGTWGSIPTSGNTIYVQAGATGGNGSIAAPYATIAAGIAAASSGATIAIAGGNYTGGVVVDKTVSLWGVCPGAVTVNGGFSDAFIITAPNVEIHDLTITGQLSGVSVLGQSGVVLDRLRVYQTGYSALSMSGGSATVRGSLFEHNAGSAVLVFGGAVDIDTTMVRDTEPSADGDYGYGLSINDDTFTGVRGNATLRRSVISFARALGVGAWGSDVVIEDSLIADTQPRASDQGLGGAVFGLMQPSTLERSHITVRRSVAERNRWCGICVEDADLVIEDSVSRDTLAQASDGAFGFGVRAFNYSNAAPVAPALDISRSLIERSRLIGMAVVGADATASKLVIRDIAPRVSDDRMGRPISVEPSQATKRPSHIDLTGARLERGFESGMMIIGATANIDSVLVSSIAPHAINDSFGVGIAYVRDIFNGIDTGGAVTNTVVEDVHTVGIAALGANVGISNTITRNVQPELASGDFGDGIIASEWIFVLELFEASMTVDRVTVEDSARAGIVAFSAEVSVADSALECNVIQLDKEPVLDGSPIFEDRGGNHCGCGEASEACKVLTSDIEPPQPPT